MPRLARSRTRSRLRVLRVRGLDFPLTLWLASREVPAPLDLPLPAVRSAGRSRNAFPARAEPAAYHTSVGLSDQGTSWHFPKRPGTEDAFTRRRLRSLCDPAKEEGRVAGTDTS